jgi:hypothetical protein
VGPLDGVTDRPHESRARIILEKLPICWIISEFQHSPGEDSNFARKVLIAKARASGCQVRYPHTYPREQVGAFVRIGTYRVFRSGLKRPLPRNGAPGRSRPGAAARGKCPYFSGAVIRSATGPTRLPAVPKGPATAEISRVPCKALHLHVRRASCPVKESTTTKVAGDFRTASRYAMTAAVPALPLSMQPQTVKPMKAASATTGTARSS